MHNAQDYYHFHGFGSAQEGGGVWLQNHKKCTGWQATKLNLKTCFICIFIFLCPIGSRLAIPKPNHIRSPHKKQCIMHRTIIIFMVLEVPRRGGGVWLQNHKKCTGWHATSKLNLKTFFIYIFIFLCPIGSRPAIPKPNHMILSPHNACIKGQTGPGRGPLWGAKVKREYFVFRKKQINQKKTNRLTVHAGTVRYTRLFRAGYYLSLFYVWGIC